MELPRFHRLRGPLYRLEGSLCGSCGAKHFPARSVCPECRSDKSVPHRFRGDGVLWSFSEMHQLQRGFPRHVPRLVGLVKLDEGPLVFAQLTDAESEELVIGMRVQMVTRLIRALGENGYRVYGYKFRPVVGKEAPSPVENTQSATLAG